MLSTVGFDDEFVFDADEINDERADGTLSSELVADQTAIAERSPKPALRVGLVETQLTRSCICHEPSPYPHPTAARAAVTLSRSGRGAEV